jgi:hypothetical protein
VKISMEKKTKIEEKKIDRWQGIIEDGIRYVYAFCFDDIHKNSAFLKFEL